MAYRYEIIEAAAKDLFNLTRHNQRLLHAIATQHIPAILRDPSHVRAYDLTVRGVAYRLIYQVQDDVVLFIAIGPHDAAYQSAKRR